MSKESVEIDLKIADDGELSIPKSVLQRLRVQQGSQVHVRLTTNRLSDTLKARNVTEEEVETIAALQLEPRDNVVKFLATESHFAGNSRFLSRVRKLRSRR